MNSKLMVHRSSGQHWRWHPDGRYRNGHLGLEFGEETKIKNTVASRPGPSSPIPWIKACIDMFAPTESERSKILLGLNFYGFDFVPGSGEPVLGNKYLELLKKYKPKIIWDPKSYEHLLEYKTGIGNHVVYYPSLKSISDRLQYATGEKLGISIWEIGQGLDYFYDLL